MAMGKGVFLAAALVGFGGLAISVWASRQTVSVPASLTDPAMIAAPSGARPSKDPAQVLAKGRDLLKRMQEDNRPKSVKEALKEALKQGLITKDEVAESKRDLELLWHGDAAHSEEAGKLFHSIVDAEEQGKKVQQQAIQQAVADDADGRSAYAARLERNFLSGGFDITVKVSGPKATTLTLRYVLFNRPAIYNLTTDANGKETDLLSTCRKLGFKKLVFSDGYEKTWTYSLD